MPSTSVQIWISRASSAAPISAESPSRPGRAWSSRPRAWRRRIRRAPRRAAPARGASSRATPRRVVSGERHGRGVLVVGHERAARIDPLRRDARFLERGGDEAAAISSPAATTRTARVEGSRRRPIAVSTRAELVELRCDAASSASRGGRAPPRQLRDRVAMPRLDASRRARRAATAAAAIGTSAAARRSFPTSPRRRRPVGPATRRRLTIATTRPMASASATDVPPNFITSGRISRPAASPPPASTRR